MSALGYVTPTMLSVKCQMQIRFFHIEKWKLPPGIAKVLGKVFHKHVLEVDQQRRIDTGSYAPLEELQEGLVHDLQDGLKDVDPLDPDLKEGGDMVTACQKQEKIGLKLLDKYNENRDVLAGRQVERPFLIDFGETKLKGYIDVDVNDGAFKDAKTRGSTRQMRQATVDEDLQFGAYAAAKALMDGQQDQTLEGVYFYKSERPTVQVIPSYRGPSHHQEMMARAAILARAIDSDSLMPVDRSSQAGWVCSEKYCGAYHPRPEYGFSGCIFGARARVSVGGFHAKE